jgi:hypothetical protein
LDISIIVLIDKEQIDRAESIIQRERHPIGLLELRRSLGLPSKDASELTKALKADPRFYRVGSLWYVRKAKLKIKVRYCPNCSSKKVKLEGGFYRCPNCEIKFHFTWLL